MKILVTGGLGFIGSNFIIRCFGNEDVEILNFDAKTYASDTSNLFSLPKNKKYTLVEGDICDQEKVGSVLDLFKPDAIINFAAESHVDKSITGPAAFIKTNVLGTYNLLGESLKYWEQLQLNKKRNFRFFHISTDEVYGSLEYDEPAFSENTPYDPSSPYSASKAASDHFVQAYNRTYGLPTLLSNCSNNYGPRQHQEKFIPTVIDAMVGSKKVPIYGNGLQVRDWLHVSDHCDAIWLILKNSMEGEIYNIGGNAEYSNLEVVKIIAQSLEKQLGAFSFEHYFQLVEHIKDRPGHDKRYAIDSSKIRKLLNWTPKMKFLDGIASTVAWYLKNKYQS